ncbi:hypothetical protein LMG28614_06682 [Paraburkholderia ultramafica]|uniref:Uncharacterized protein n=1 Tax=Paraburkholderia ultramafica TaxID=1544867 RepID=A0A6S7BPJ8_9BURK|nr:hypothetical protein [Paraburkholderia ultramafica]CAB3807848.1 hypothetical protein LMG28614_06682 [Paraburkholderia ultramafica]
MNRSAGAAAKRLPGSERKQLAVQALAGAETISELSARLGVSRKFVYAQRGKASDALDDAFSLAAPDDGVLFQLPVTRTWLRQAMLGLTLIWRSSYRALVELMQRSAGRARQCGQRSQPAAMGRAAGPGDQPRAGPLRHSRGPA